MSSFIGLVSLMSVMLVIVIGSSPGDAIQTSMSDFVDCNVMVVPDHQVMDNQPVLQPIPVHAYDAGSLLQPAIIEPEFTMPEEPAKYYAQYRNHYISRIWDQRSNVWHTARSNC